MHPHSIRYNRIMSIVLVVLGVLIAVISLLTSAWVTVATGVILAILGVLTLINPMIRIEPHEVQLRNPVGMTLKRFPIASPADLALEGKTLRHVPTGKRIATLSFGVHGPDVDALRAAVPSRPAA
jgi:hypothetical protein